MTSMAGGGRATNTFPCHEDGVDEVWKRECGRVYVRARIDTFYRATHIRFMAEPDVVHAAEARKPRQTTLIQGKKFRGKRAGQ